MSKRLVALPVALIAIAAFAPGIANATNFSTTSTITIASTGKAFTGTVKSPHSACVPNRNVVLQRKLQGQQSFTTVGSDKTNSAGAWSVATNVASGAQYRALVSQKNLSASNRCNGATTAVLTARNTTSTIVINTLGNAFNGKVGSVSSACIQNRTVRLQRKNPGGTTFANIGAPDATDANGNWSVLTDPVANAQYRGSVAAKKSGSNACMAALSPVTTAKATNLSIQQGGSTNFHGVANSSVSACKSNRTVTLQRKGIYETTFTNVGSDASDANGNWLVPTAVQSGASYRAKTGAKQKGAFSCLDDLSNVVVAS
jgi:hypothetical protein